MLSKINTLTLALFIGLGWSFIPHTYDKIGPPVVTSDITTDTLLARSYLEKAKAFHFENQNDSARFYFRAGIALYQTHEQWRLLSLAKQNLANHFVKNDLLDSAKVLLRESISIFKAHHLADTALLIRINFNLFETFNRRLEELDSGITVATSTLHLIKSYQYPKQAMDLLNTYNFINLGYRSLGFPEQAEAYIDSALQVLERQEIPNRDFYYGMLYHNKGANFSKAGNYQEALLYHAQSKEALERIAPDWIDINQPLTAMSNILISINKSPRENYQALSHLREAERLLVDTGNEKHYYMPYTYYAFARAYINLAEYDSALWYMDKAITINEQLYGEEYGEQGYVLKTLGLINYRQKNFETAEDYLKQSIALIKTKLGGKFQLTASAYMNLGKIYKDQGQKTKALEHFHEALFYITYNFNDSSVLINPALEDLKANANAVSILQNKADLLKELYFEGKDPNYLNASLETYKLVSNYIDFVRKGYYNLSAKVLFNEKTDTVYQNAIESILSLQDPSNPEITIRSAFRLADERKASLLQEQIQESKAQTFALIPDSIQFLENLLKSKIFQTQQKIQNLQHATGQNEEKINQARGQLIKFKSDLEYTKNHLEDNYEKYYRLKYQPAYTTYEHDYTRNLSSKDLVVEYSIGSDRLYVFLLGPSLIDYLELPLLEDFESQVIACTQGIKEKNFNQFVKHSYSLYEYLLKPALDKMKAANPVIDRLVIVPDGILGYLPFETLLQRPGTKSGAYSELDYLIKDYEISYHYSASLLASPTGTAHKAPKEPFVGFAPQFIDQSSANFLALNERTRAFIDTLIALPFAEKEVSSIADLLAGQAEVGNTATEHNFKQVANKYRILHLASHSIIDDEEPLYSRILFDNQYDSIDDGYLHTYELYNMDINAELVTLSSCNTGVGKYYKGEGVMSLARGFMYAGVPNLVMSLWSVPDEPTKDLMTYFYEELHAGTAKSRALRKAKLKYLQNADDLTAAPYYWGSFIYLGQIETPTRSFKWWHILSGIALILLLGMVYRKFNATSPS